MQKKTLSLLCLPLLLSGCTSSLPLEFTEYKDYAPLIDTHSAVNWDEANARPVEDAKYYRSGLTSKVTLPYTSYGLNEVSSLKTISASRDGKNVFHNVGELKLVVVPVTFEEQRVDEKEQEAKKVHIQNAFFGDKTHNSYESVASYYNKSSYGKVKITGEVVDWFECSYTVDRAINEAKNNGSGEVVSRNIAAQVADYLHELTNRPGSTFDINDYDNDNDGVIDGIYIVYDYPQDDSISNRSPLFWAYFDKVTKGFDGLNNDSPYASSYSWSSFYFTGSRAMSENIVEANTFIHETGHLFGLDDYYNTNSKTFNHNGSYSKETSGVFQPTGFMEMMDYNLGDHCAFSKYLLDWANPYVIQDECEITLRSLTKSGDFAIFPAPNWNGTAFDEYLLLEYFTPDDLNSSFNFPSYSYFDGDNVERIYTYPNRHGLRVYHVDARLAYFRTRTLKSEKIAIDASQAELEAWKTTNPDVGYVDFLNTNATQGTVDSNAQVLLHLLEADGKNNLLNGIAASNTTLFGINSTFGYDVYKDFVFNKKDASNEHFSFDYKFKVSKLSSDQVTLTIEKK